jgi:hypothetical protein
MAAITTVETRTLGEAWLETCHRILADGCDGLPMRELSEPERQAMSGLVTTSASR